MDYRVGIGVAILVLGPTAMPGMVHAQRAAENAVTSAEDAFGTHVGVESTGIYTDRNTRGFSPLEAGNVRIDGIYFDQVAAMSSRLRALTAIRVGFSATDFPFVAPTGVVDHKFKDFPKEYGNSLTYTRYPYAGHIEEWDLRLPVIGDRVGLIGGFARANTRQVDGGDTRSWGWTLSPIVRVSGIEFRPYAAWARFTENEARPLVVVRDGYLPQLPGRRQFLAQKWASGKKLNHNYGATLKARISDHLSFRGGLFKSIGGKRENYSEIYTVIGDGSRANHVLFADPEHTIHSTSGEAIIALTLGNARFQHRFFGGYRMRNRFTETGGSDFVNFTQSSGPVVYGEADQYAEPNFTFSAVNAGRVRQSSWMLGYIGKLGGLGKVNIGVQKARYRATSLQGSTGQLDLSRAEPWLYNATVMVNLTPSISMFVATQRGLEDSGTAPETAANRNEQLPATKTTQYEGGVRWDFGRSHLILSAFEISKPYFSSDAANHFVRLGTRRHRGIEGSLAGHFGDRLDLLAGAVFMKPEVTGPARDQGLVGKRPAGTPTVYGQVDANYRTDLIGGLTLTGALNYTGKRAVTSRPIARLGNDQLALPGWLRVDLGLRHRFKVGKTDVSARAVVQNVFDEKQWYVVAADVLYPEERRRLIATLSVDF